MGRAPCCDKANVKKGPWSPEEDAKLKEYIEKFGTGGNWISLPQKAGLKRCGKSCRLRWLNYLRPNIKHGEFSDEEDRIICSLYASIGSRWSIIAAQLPGRTDNDIKNYWNTKLKKKLISTINNNNNNNTSKKPHQNQNHHLYQYYPMFQNHYPSSLSSPSSLLSHAISPSSSSSYQCTSTYYNDSPSNSMTMSFTQGCYNNISSTSNNNNNNTLILKQDYPHQMLKDNSTLLVFGGDHHHQNHQHQPSSCSSDGSCSITQMITNQVKQEDHHDNNIQHQQNYGGQVSVNHHQGKRLSYVNHGDHNTDQMLVDQKPSCVTTTAGLWGQNSQNTSLLLDYGLEEIKQLISTNINVDNSFNYFGENKAEEKDTKVMYCYY